MKKFLLMIFTVVMVCLFSVFGMGGLDAVHALTGASDRAKIISVLPLEKLEPGRHHFSVPAGHTNTGHTIHVPVIVVEGEKPGPGFLLTAAVHGDELNGIRVLHRLAENTKPDKLTGRLIMIPGVNQSGMWANNRHFIGSSGGGYMSDLNRVFPGNSLTGNSAERYAGNIWNAVIKGKADFAVDLHTQTRGTAYPLFVFADFRHQSVKEIAFALNPEIIKDDPGEEGTLETSLIESGIPAVTLEIGEAKKFQPDLIEKAVSGLENVMRLKGMLSGDVEKAKSAPFVGSRYTNVEADTGGTAIIDVSLGQLVKKGDRVATMFDLFGTRSKIYKAPHNGIVLAIATDPLREVGSMLVRILR